MLKLPSPLQKINWPLAQQKGVEVWLKRDDQIHPVISGNKWRKLLYNFKYVQENNLKGVVTFGGAFSNHIAATAYAGDYFNVSTVGIIRGQEANFNNPTLQQAQQNGMQLLAISRDKYATKNSAEFLNELQNKYPNYLIVPEGGANIMGVWGCMEILQETPKDFDLIAVALGSATTFSGIVASAKAKKVLGFPALKGGDYLRETVSNFLKDLEKHPHPKTTFTATPNWDFNNSFHFGGFAKVKEDLVVFMNTFWEETGVALDPIYTGKMMFGVKEMLQTNQFKKGTKILAIHTGGLQGIKGINQKLKNKSFKIEYEKHI